MASVMLYPCILCVALLMDLFVLCVHVFINYSIMWHLCVGVLAVYDSFINLNISTLIVLIFSRYFQNDY